MTVGIYGRMLKKKKHFKLEQAAKKYMGAEK